MATIDFKNIRHEITHELRKGDILTETVRGVTETTQTPTVSAAQTQITLTNTPVRNIDSFTVDGVQKYFIRDWTINWTTGVITMVSAFAGGESVSITYDYGGSEKIYPDFPRDDLQLSSYPRVGISLTSATTESFELGGGADISDIIVTVFAMVPANKDSAVAGGLGGTDDLSDLTEAIRNKIRAYNKSFVSFPFIRALTVNPITYSKDNKIMMQSADFQIQFLVE